MAVDNLSLNRLYNPEQMNTQFEKAMKQLSSTLRINSSGNDSPGLAISETLRTQIRRLEQTTRNTLEGRSLLQTAGGALNEMNSVLQRMRELAVQAANGTSSAAERESIENEADDLRAAYDNIVNSTEFNEEKLLNGTYSAEIQVGPSAGETVTVNISSMAQSAVGLDTLDTPASKIGTAEAVDIIDNAIKAVANQQSYLAGVQNRVETEYALQSVTKQSLVSTESQLRDFDTAKGLMDFTNKQLVSQMLQAQANLSPQAVLRLLS